VLPEVTSSEITSPDVTRSDVTESDVSHVIGGDVTRSDVIFPRFFLIRVVVQNVPLLFVIRFKASDYSFGIFWSLCCFSFDLRLLIIPLVSFGHCVVVIRFTASDYSFSIL
jgi:hypothetical protein